ncbi:MAG: DUF47 family protein [Acidobacteriota bacterium]|nr:MAG: DUF47 family protein [Acidobacteriota bacterium]
MPLLGFLYRKQRRIEAMTGDYLDQCRASVDHFRRAMELYVQQGRGREFLFMVEQTHKHESRADDLRRRVEYEMYAKALLPESRGDLLGFLERVDQLPNIVQKALYRIANERIDLPAQLQDDFARLVDSSCVSAELLLQMAQRMFNRDPAVVETRTAIDEKESECDYIESELIKKLFSSDAVSDLQKILLRGLVRKLGDLSDAAQEVSDRLLIMSLKRRV